MLKRTAILSVLACLSLMGSAQPLSIPKSPRCLPDSSTLGVCLDGSSYFYNYEYFKPFAKGYTQPGFALVPTIRGNLGSRLLFGAGVHLNKYWGTKRLVESQPVMIARCEALKNFFIQIGTIENHDGHMLTDILYNPLHKVDFRPENGLQLRYYGRKFFFDTWVSWENYISQGDLDQERMTAGGSFLLRLTPDQSRFEVILPFQAVYKHIGGQINDKSDTSKRVQTFSNISLSFQVAYRYNERGGKVGLLFQPIKFNGDFGPKGDMNMKGGRAISSTLFVSNDFFDLKVGSLFGKMIYPVLGDPIYGSMDVDLFPIAESRKVFFGSFDYHKEVYPGVLIRFDTGCYLTYSYSGIDYFYGVGLIYNFQGQLLPWSRR